MKAENKAVDEGRGACAVDGSSTFPRPLSPVFSLCLALVFLVAFGVRVLSWQDTRLETGKVQAFVTDDYKRVARLLRQGGVSSFFSAASPLADLNALGHPPGYSVLLALIFGLFGESDTSIQFIQITADAAAALLTVFLAAELLPRGAAVVAGMLAALAPQFAWNSVLLLPDTLAALPILLAVYCLARAMKRPRLSLVLAAGMLVGLSCWLRANALLLAPFLAVAVVCVLSGRGVRPARYALALVCGTLLVVAPLTVRNAVVFGSFIPLSLGAGQTLLEGIADYDREKRFGIPATDLGIIRGEAEASGRPDYAETLFGPDGIQRERARMSRGFAVIREHPLWFATVITRRAASMLRLERARTVSAAPPVTHSLAVADETPPAWSNSPAELSGSGQILSGEAAASLSADGEALIINGDGSKYAPQFASAPVVLDRDTDYLFDVPLKIERGRMTVSVTRDGDLRAALVSTIVGTTEGLTPGEQPRVRVQLPFVSVNEGRVRVLLSNAAPDTPRTSVQVGPVKLFALGPAAYVWTRYPRFVVSNIQKLFITAVMLPLSVIGAILLWRGRHRRTLIVLLVVPVYYFCVQSILHTEYRYVLALHYFLFILAAVSFYRAGGILLSAGRQFVARSGQTGKLPRES
ncbi:MAG: glycosyltransferase family 39 protein [Acidobacteria bacterium]|nr:glycosyltransferase family 39 protein [Acidobacteriota bacterium]